MEDRLTEILDNVLSLLLLEGSYDINTDDNGLNVTIETTDAGRLIGFKGESLSALQLLVNQMLSRSFEGEEFKRVIIDVGGWRQNKEEQLKDQAKRWVEEVKETSKEIELEPMPSWQRRIVHMVVSEEPAVESESLGEGRDRHLVIRPAGAATSTEDEVPANDSSKD
jgi:spoIIIJ-associated protein